MIVRRFYDTRLAQASYLIGCGQKNAAVVIDPNRDVDQYLAAAREEGVAITHVTETHIHADFVSGARELAHRTGAALYLSDEGDRDWKYAYASNAGAILVRGGDVFQVGNVRVEVVHTPGHTPEHISFLITDTAAADEPIGIVTGDFVFVGDVGRPDLLERAANYQGTMEQAGRTLFRSLQRFKQYPDWLQIWPGHGAGSACGKGLSAVPHSTVGYERRFNWAFRHDDEDAFVQAVLAGQPEPPKYFAEMKRINKQGPPLLRNVPRPERLPAGWLDAALATSAIVVDARRAADYARAHVPGTINIPLDRSFTTWAGWLIPYDRDFHVIIDDRGGQDIAEAMRDLTMIGLDHLAGWFGVDAIEGWREKRELGRVQGMTADELAERLDDGGVTIVDVRGQAEWEAGHIPGVGNVPLGHLADRMAQIPRDRPIVVHCQSGARSAIAASLLRARGVSQVFDLAGGLAAWQAGGHPVVRGAREHKLVETT